MGNHPKNRSFSSQETQQMLADSLKRLLRTRPLEKISVSDIVKDCHTSRNTFYYHFQDKYDLVIWIFRTETEAWLTVDARTPEDDVAMILKLCDYFRANRAFYRGALAYSGQNSLREYLDQLVYQRLLARLCRLFPKEEASGGERELRFAAEFFTAALVGLFSRWMEHGMEEDVTVYHNCIRRILSGQLLEGYLSAGKEDML